MVHYVYQRDGSRAIRATASTREAALDWVRSVFRKGTKVRIYWEPDTVGSGYWVGITC